MEISNSLKTVLKRLRLSPILHTLPERLAYARKTQLDYADLLELVLQDEIDRREQQGLQLRLDKAAFTEAGTFRGGSTGTRRHLRSRSRPRPVQPRLPRPPRRRALHGTGRRGQDPLGRSLEACGCGADKQVLCGRADALFTEFLQARADHTTRKTLRRYLAPQLLIIHDSTLRRLDPRQSSDIYEVIIARHRRASTIFTSNRTVDEWIPLFDDPMLAQNALDRLAHNAHQVVMEDESFRNGRRQGWRHAPPRLRRVDQETTTVRGTPNHPMEAAGPMDGRRIPRSADASCAAAHRTSEIPAGFPQAPTGSHRGSLILCEKISIGLETPGS